MADRRYLEQRLSGGASNTDPTLALGGAMSTVAGGVFVSQQFSGTPPTNMTILRGNGNAAGAGTLTFTLSGATLKWMAFGSSYGPAIPVAINTTYILYTPDFGAYIVVSTGASLPVADSSATITVSDVSNTVFNSIGFSESVAGHTDYRCIFLKNTHGTDTMSTLRVWIEQDPVGASTISFGADPNGVNNVAVSIANENTAPSGVTFSTPTMGAPLTLGSVPAGQYVALWLKRVITAGASTGSGQSLMKIGVTWL